MKVKKQKLVFLGLFLLFQLTALSQSSKPNVVPPSPKSQNFLRFGNTPVSYNTGVPDISIPLYVIKSGDIEVPIVLRYHVRSVRPGPDPSDVGFGWVLDFGGQISRTIYGAPDDAAATPPVKYAYNELDESTGEKVQYLNSCLDKTYNTEYDIFNYQFLSQSGSFILDKISQGVFKPHLLSFNPAKFRVFTTPNTYSFSKEYITTIKATDAKGNVATFGDGAVETSLMTSDKYGITSWLIKEITNAAGTDYIRYTYSAIPQITSCSNQTHMNISSDYLRTLSTRFLDVLPQNDVKKECMSSSYGSGECMRYDNQIITQISFKGGTIVFDVDCTKNQINGFQIKDSNGNLIKK